MVIKRNGRTKNECFKMKNKISGVYKITNIVTHVFYIGSSNDCDKRIKDHFKKLQDQKHANLKLQNAFNKHGIENFKFEILEIIIKNKGESSLDFRKRLAKNNEQHYLDTLLFAQEYIKKENKKFELLGYNIRPIADTCQGLNPWNKGLTKENDQRILLSTTKGGLTKRNVKKKRGICNACGGEFALNILYSCHNEKCYNRKKYLDSLREKKKLRKQIKYKCDRCQIECTKTNLIRWHNNNCKSLIK